MPVDIVCRTEAHSLACTAGADPTKLWTALSISMLIADI